MKILDRYILGKFVRTFLFVVLLLNLIVCVVDYTEKSDDFIKHNLGLQQIFSEYYINLFVYWVTTLSPISVFIAIVFITARMAAHAEVTAILTSGISFWRFMRPSLIGAAIFGVAIFGLQGWVVPLASQERVAFEVKYLKSPFYFSQRDLHMRVNDSTYLYMESYNNYLKRGYRSTLEKMQGQRLVEKISSSQIQWDSVGQQWQMDEYKVATYADSGLVSVRDGKDLRVNLGVQPQYFESKYKLDETLTTPELDGYIASERARGNANNIDLYRYAKYQRYAYPVAIIILTAMGVIVSARKTRGGSGMLVAVGFILAFVFILFSLLSKSIAQSGTLDPLLAAWLPNITFFFITLVMYWRLPK